MDRKLTTVITLTNVAIRMGVALLACFIPVLLVLRELSDPQLRKPGIPQSAWRLHRQLTPRFEHWANQRLSSTRASQLPVTDISGTEWPLFGSVFYLWATESLQDAWETNHQFAAEAPRAFAKEAIVAAARLVIDPKHASWVKTHWGDNYLKTENVFYRMLVISALTSHARLTDDRQYLPLLRDQVESLSSELNASPHGILNDYPGECYPADVLTAIAMIRRADRVLGTDHSEFVRRAMRSFQGKQLDSHGLVPYAASASTGMPLGPARGCGNSYVSLFAPGIWPEQAREWYELYTRFFWQNVWTAVGFREFPNDISGYDWHMDVDAGPVLKGYGFAACAFGMGAARVNGRFDHAFPLATEMFAVSCPLPDGTLLVPRLLSNAADAPYLGEAAILFFLTRLPAPNVPIVTGGGIPLFACIVLALQATLGLLITALAWRTLRRWRKRGTTASPSAIPIQFAVWCCLVAGAAGLLLAGHWMFALAALLATQLLPAGIGRYQQRA